MLSAISGVGEAYVAKVERSLYFASKDQLEAIAAKELLERARKRLVTVLDVRPPEELAAAICPARYTLIHQLETRIKELPQLVIFGYHGER